VSTSWHMCALLEWKKDISLNTGTIKCTVIQAKEHVNRAILKPRLVINLGKVYRVYVLSYKYQDNFRHLLVRTADGKYDFGKVLTWKKENNKLVLHYIRL
jgi:hypothetical protein